MCEGAGRAWRAGVAGAGVGLERGRVDIVRALAVAEKIDDGGGRRRQERGRKGRAGGI